MRAGGSVSLPDATGLEALEQVLATAPHAAVIVLTGLDDAHVGLAAVTAGAQDYLVKQDVDARLLTRAIRYAIERKRADLAQRSLVKAELLAQENDRLERGLLPVPVLTTGELVHEARYLPGRERTLLAGDFYDTVQSPDGSVHAVVGDVCGHGPDEAALGVALRIAWRTLVLAGHAGNELLRTLDSVLRLERKLAEGSAGRGRRGRRPADPGGVRAQQGQEQPARGERRRAGHGLPAR